MKTSHIFFFFFLVFGCMACTRPAQDASTLELRNLDISTWDAKDDLDGKPVNAVHAARNRQKNRLWRELQPTDSIQHYTFYEFLRAAEHWDSTIGIPAGQHPALTVAQEQALERQERQLVSVTGWMVLTYPAGAESTNSYSPIYHDWHIEIVPQPLDHYPRVGDPTAIICEITPRTEAALYQAGLRLRQLAAFMRTGSPPNITSVPTSQNAKPHKVRVTGYLFRDNSHAEAGEDIGIEIERSGQGAYHHPWRATAWEVHPILRIEDLGTK
jgi:hypothetical protein